MMSDTNNITLLTKEEIDAAYDIVKESSICYRTPLLSHVEKMFGMEGVDLYLKLESCQKTGSFKVRGLSNQLQHLPPGVSTSERRLITMSAGNYGKAFAYALHQLGLKPLVVMPERAPQSREDLIKSYGADVERLPTQELQPAVDRYVKEENMLYLHSFDDPLLIAGHGSIGLEILEEVPDVEVVIVCCGGGGLLAGIATAIKLNGKTTCRIYGVEPQGGECYGLLAGIATAIKLSGKTACRVYGVEPHGACTMYKSFQVGHAVSDTICTIAAGLAPPFAGKIAYHHCRQFVEDIVLVSDEELIQNMQLLFTHGLVVEPSGAAAFTALNTGKIPDISGKKVVVVITGSNVTPDEMCGLKKRI